MKKIIVTLIIVIALLCSIVAYFAPLSLSNAIKKDCNITMILQEFLIEDGMPDIRTVNYQNVTDEQKSNILEILEQHPYKRTLRTPFSTGAMTEFGEYRLSVYVYSGDEFSGSIVITSSGQIAVNGKNYHIKNAETLIAQIIDIIE